MTTWDPRETVARPKSSQLPAQLLAGAREELLEQGPDGFSLRSVARRVGVSHQATANHFKDRQGLLTAVAAEGFRRFDAALDRAGREPASDIGAGDRVAALGTAYLRFAAAEGPVFRLMWSDALLDVSDSALVVARLAVWSRLIRTVSEATEHGWGGGQDPAVLAAAAWAAAHGLTQLAEGTMSLLPGFFPDPELVVRCVTHAIATGGPLPR